MIGVYQKYVEGPPRGDCFKACIASVLEIELGDAPDIQMDSEDYWEHWQDWMYERGLQLAHYDDKDFRPRGFWIASIDVGDWQHCLVYRSGLCVWQPDPNWSLERTQAKYGDKIVSVTELHLADIRKLAKWLESIERPELAEPELEYAA